VRISEPEGGGGKTLLRRSAGCMCMRRLKVYNLSFIEFAVYETINLKLQII
jgi:hypothetical protein